MVYLLSLTSYCLFLVSIFGGTLSAIAETTSPVITIDRNRVNLLNQLDQTVSNSARDLTTNSISPSNFVVDENWQYLKPSEELTVRENEQSHYFFGQLDSELNILSQDDSKNITSEATESPNNQNNSNNSNNSNAPPRIPGLRLSPSLNEGSMIDRIFIHLENPHSDPTKNQEYQRQIAETFQIRAGANFSSLFADLSLRQVQNLPFVKSAEYRLYGFDNSGEVILALLVTLQDEVTKTPIKSKGILVNGDFSQFPTLYESDRSLVKLILNGGVGVFSDTNPWFDSSQNFLAPDYQPQGTVTWPEFYIEPGIGGITQIGKSPIYTYGAVSYTESATLAPDIFTSDTRFYGDIEQLYGGFLIAKKDFPVLFNFSIGRQKFQLNRNFLFAQVLGSANALERGSTFLNARKAYDNAILGNLRIGNFLLQGFYLDPDELPISDTNSRFLGINARYNDNKNLELALSYITVPESDGIYVLPNGEQENKQGLQVINPRIRLNNLFDVEGLWLESEYAYEWNRNFSMNAQAGYIWLGYTFLNTTWRPSFSYRFAGFSGDDPNTKSYERFDPLRGGGFGDWLQGVNLSKIYTNSNVLSHRLEFKVNPSNRLLLSLDYFYLFTDQLNNLGGVPALSNLESRSIGQELLFTTRWSISSSLVFVGVAGLTFPNDAINLAVTGNTNPWLTLQMSLFLGF